MRNLIKVLIVLGCCLFGAVTGVVGVQAAAPTVTTTTITAITSTTASSGGNVTDSGGVPVTARGVCWSTSSDPTTADSITIDGTGEGVFVSSITGLNPGTAYHVRAYATNSEGTSYGDDSTFTTLTTPTVTTATITSITSTTASGGGAIPDSGGATITAKGVCWNTSGTPTIASDTTNDGTGAASFTSSLTSLTPATLYYVRAYATNSEGTSYGDDSTFTTLTTPTVTTATITSITSTTASGGGNVTADGGDSVTARGVCWSTSADPTTADSTTTDGSGAGAFTSSLTSLTPGTLYHVRAYATNSVGTSYGGDSTFTTLTTPTVTTATIISITSTTASGGGAIPDSGGATITAKGVCWNTSGTPTIANDTTNDGTGAASFTSSLTSLTPATLYHVRAYATNSVGTSYGGDSTFTTLQTFTISGHVWTSDSTGIDSVTMNGLLGDPLTDSTGYYTAAVDYGWSGVVTPDKDGYTFAPESTSYSNVTDNQETDYTGTLLMFTISGYVRNTDSVGVEGVVLSGLPGDPATDTGGYYAATVPYGWSGRVTPTDTCVFEPEYRDYDSVTTDQTYQSYVEDCLSQDVDDDKDNLVPQEYQLAQNHPNPFNPTTEIVFGLPKAGFATLRIYNILGQEVTILVNKYMSAGRHRVTWNGTDKSGRAVSSGVYFYRMQSKDFAQTKQMLLLK
jgi:hypothetical protein